MNTAARMEQTGKMNQIHISSVTADLLKAAGKGHWIVPRDGMVEAKGKGKMQTYWVKAAAHDEVPSANTTNTSNSSTDVCNDIALLENTFTNNADVQRLLSKKVARLIDWNVDVLQKLLKQIAARRQSNRGSYLQSSPPLFSDRGTTPLQEVVEIIELPKFDARAMKKQVEPESVVLHPIVLEQLQKYVTNIASL
jgi:hypothetical protein